MKKNMMEVFKDYPMMACVSDSYDYNNSVDNIWGIELKDDILRTGKTYVCRPDKWPTLLIA